MSKTLQADTGKEERICATLLLERPAEIDYPLLMQRVGGPLGLDPTQAEKQKPDGPLVFTVDGDFLAGLNMNLPYPESLDQPAAFAYWWPDALKDIARHKAHFMVLCSWPRLSRIEAHMRHLLLMRELVEQLPVIGVLWGSVLMPAELFKGEFANAQKGGFPFSLWVLIQYSRQPNGAILISTLGMRDFGCMEIETESSLPLDQTFDLVRKLGSYILAEQPNIKDGDTVGFSADHRIKVSHVRSFRPDVNDKVYWLELCDAPSVKKPKGFFSGLFGSGSKN